MQRNNKRDNEKWIRAPNDKKDIFQYYTHLIELIYQSQKGDGEEVFNKIPKVVLITFIIYAIDPNIASGYQLDCANTDKQTYMK